MLAGLKSSGEGAFKCGDDEKNAMQAGELSIAIHAEHCITDERFAYTA